MLSKSATLLLGLIREQPINAYEIIRKLHFMNAAWWLKIGDSTVYSTLRLLEKKGLIAGSTEKTGNMPDRTVYRLTEQGEAAFLDTLRGVLTRFDFDASFFSVAAFFIDAFETREKKKLLEKRLRYLEKYRDGIGAQLSAMADSGVPSAHAANVGRMMDLVDAEIAGTLKLLETCK